MSLRDLVAGECAEPNALVNFMGNFTTDRHNLHQDQWVQDSSSQSLEIDRQHLDQLREEQLDSAFHPEIHDAPLHMDRFAQPAFMGPSSSSSSSNPLSALLKSFISSRPLMSMPIPLGLSEGEKAKIRDRTAIMAHHLYAEQPQEQINHQLDELFKALDIEEHHIPPGGDGPDWQNMEAAWGRPMPMGPQGPMMRHRRGPEVHRLGPRHADGWAAEFEQEGGFHTSSTSLSHNTEDEIAEYERMMHHTQGTQAWMEEAGQLGPVLTDRDMERHYEEAYRRAGSTWAHDYISPGSREWVEDYVHKTDEELDEDAMNSVWDEIGYDKTFESAWRDNADLASVAGNITRIDDPKLQQSNFMKFMSKISHGEVLLEGNQVIEAVPSDDSYSRDNIEKWTEEYSTFHGSVDDGALREYEFALRGHENPYFDLQDPLQKGIELFNEGLISEAILAFETEVDRNPNNSKAWQYLGQAHAENDKDNQAITCLVKAVEADPNNLEALCTLAVSYTNDFHKEKALETLEIWMKRNPKYSHITPPQILGETMAPPLASPFADTWARHAMVSEMFLEAARIQPHDPDPEVQTILGLLYNLSYEYEKAVDCFKAALTKRPDDYLLWNKLGATLANSNRSEEAVGAYYQAIEKKPTYVRARANLGISYLALNVYHEAARNFLTALAMHPDAVHIWDNLKMVFRLMNRDDLVGLCDERDVNMFNDKDF